MRRTNSTLSGIGGAGAEGLDARAAPKRAMNALPHVSEPSEKTMPRGLSILWTHHSKLSGSQPRRIECGLQ